jgi:hypothetical protein
LLGEEKKKGACLLELLVHVIVTMVEQIVGSHLLVAVACQECLYGGLTIETKALQL